VQSKMVQKTIPLDEPVIGEKEGEYLAECIRSGWISWQGRFVSEFEREFAS
jgi:perosamine synthetase